MARRVPYGGYDYISSRYRIPYASLRNCEIDNVVKNAEVANKATDGSITSSSGNIPPSGAMECEEFCEYTGADKNHAHTLLQLAD
eukprot:6212250-Pleurochrysis_carterae.AAC.1